MEVNPLTRLTPDAYSPGTIISRLSRGEMPYCKVTEILLRNDPTPSTISSLRRTRLDQSSIGVLEKIPLELVHLVLDNLDLRAFLAFSSLSLQANQTQVPT
jgi:hypothetical protein